MASFDEDALTHAAARGDEEAQHALAFFYMGRSPKVRTPEEGRATAQLAATFAALAASNGLVRNVDLYIRSLRLWMGWGMDPETTASLETLVDRLSAAIAGKGQDERVEVVV